MFEKNPKLILLIVAALAGVLVLADLRQQATRVSPDTVSRQVEDEEGEEDDVRFGTTRIARFAHLEPPPVRDRPAVTQAMLAERKEDYETIKQRAFGESHITGTVRTGRNSPLPGAKIELYENDPNTTNPPIREAVADADGSFTLAQLHDGERRFVMVTRAEGMAPDARYVYLINAPAEVSVWMRQGVKLEGYVRDGVTSAGLGGVKIVQPNNSNTVFGVLGSITSAPDGRFSFPNAPNGRVITRAELPTYSMVVAKLRAPTDSAEIIMAAGGSRVSGICTDRLAEKPAANAKVWLESDVIKTATFSKEDGTFEFENLPAGDYKLYGIKGMKSKEQELTLAPGESVSDLKIILPSDLFVSGRVVNANDGKILPGIRIWYRGPSGKNSVLSDKDGLFAFETMALDEYSLQVHEKGYLPLQEDERKTTGAVETLVRPVPKNASSDRLVLKLKPVAAIAGKVKQAGRDGGEPRPVANADITVDYIQNEQHERLFTRTDAKGDYFVNLASRRRGDATVLAAKNLAIAGANVRVPSRRPVNLTLDRTMMFGTLVLSDQSPLDGVKVTVSHFLPPNRENAARIRVRDFYTGRDGRLVIPMPPGMKLHLDFQMPDGNQIEKIYTSDELLKGRATFIYDPITKDLLVDFNAGRRGGGQGRGDGGGRNNGEGRRGGDGQGGGGRRPGNNGGQPGSGGGGQGRGPNANNGGGGFGGRFGGGFNSYGSSGWGGNTGFGTLYTPVNQQGNAQ